MWQEEQEGQCVGEWFRGASQERQQKVLVTCGPLKGWEKRLEKQVKAGEKRLGQCQTGVLEKRTGFGFVQDKNHSGCREQEPKEIFWKLGN